MWAGDWTFFTDQPAIQGGPHWIAGTDDMCVSDEATIPNAISIGAYVSKKDWKDYNGTSHTVDYYTVGDIAYFSSYATAEQSPTGLAYPWISAPGARLAAGVNHNHKTSVDDYSYYGSTDLVVNNANYPYAMMEGTSMATPVVSGVIALWLEAKPDLTPQEVIDALSHTSRHPDSSLTYPNNQYGYGEIDAYSGLLHILGASRIEGVSHHQPQSLHITFSNGQLQLTCDTPPAAPLHVSIYSLSGTLLHESALPSSLNSYLIPLTSYRSGLYIVQVTSSAPQYVGSQVITIKTKP